MEHSSGNRLGVWAILILVIMNIGLVGLLWMDHYRKPPPRPGDGEADPGDFFATELRLDQQQADSVKVLRREHFRKTDSIRFEMAHLNRRMIEELFAQSPDTALVQQLSDQVGLAQADFEREVYEHFDHIKQLCRPEQHERLKQLIFGAIQSKRPPPPGAGKGEDRQPPPPGDHRPPPPGDNRPPGH